MRQFNLPAWIEPHLYSGKNFNELNDAELIEIKSRLAFFKNERPLVSIVIPAYNEQDSLFRTLSSLSSNETTYDVEIIVINNSSTDNTQSLVDLLEVRNFMQDQQGIAYARELGLHHAKGEYHLCADADTLYPPGWINEMVGPMIEDKELVCVYGRHSFLSKATQDRFPLFVYEALTGILVRIRKFKREFINVHGFNMGFKTDAGRKAGGFKVHQARKLDNAAGSSYFVLEAEDGTIALNLMKIGKIKLMTNQSTRVFTSARRLVAEGGILRSFMIRIKLHGKMMFEYLSGKTIN